MRACSKVGAAPTAIAPRNRCLASQPRQALIRPVQTLKHERTLPQVVFELVDHLDIVRELKFMEATSPLAYDGWLVDGSVVVDLVTNTKLVAPVDSFIAHDSSIRWSDVTE
jgi:hypothetical protein